MCPLQLFDKTAHQMQLQLGTLCENFKARSHVRHLEYTHYPKVTSKLFHQEVYDDDSDGTKNSYASFFENSSISSYQKDSSEDDFKEITPSVFGTPTTVSQSTGKTSTTTIPSTTTPATNPPQDLNYLAAASPQMSDITLTTNTELLSTITSMTQMFKSMQASQTELQQQVTSLTNIIVNMQKQSTQQTLPPFTTTIPTSAKQSLLSDNSSSALHTVANLQHQQSSQSSKRSLHSDDSSSDIIHKRTDIKETPRRTNTDDR